MTATEKTMGWIYWALQLLAIPAALTMIATHFGWALSEAQLNFLFFGVNFAVLTVMMHRFLGRSAKEGFQRPGRTLQSAFFGYVLYWVCSIAFGALIAFLRPEFANANDATILGMAKEDYTLITIGTVILVPVAEELMYRGLIFGSLYNRSRVAAYIVSTLIFAAIHVVGYIGMWEPADLALSVLQYLPAGICLGWAYARSGTIWAPILMHMAINQTSILTMR